jgi:hypothetical protein
LVEPVQEFLVIAPLTTRERNEVIGLLRQLLDQSLEAFFSIVSLRPSFRVVVGLSLRVQLIEILKVNSLCLGY